MRHLVKEILLLTMASCALAGEWKRVESGAYVNVIGIRHVPITKTIEFHLLTLSPSK